MKSRLIIILIPLWRAMFREPFKYLEQYHTVTRKVSQSFWNKVFLKNANLTKKFNLRWSRPSSDFKVSRIFPMFASISEDESAICSCFCCRCKQLLLGNLLHTYSITVQCLESFLIAFEKKVSLKKHTVAVVCKLVSSKESKFFVKLEFFRKISFLKAEKLF